MAPIKKVVGAGKLRVSWGLTGNNRIGEYDYYALLQMLKEKQESTSLQWKYTKWRLSF